MLKPRSFGAEESIPDLDTGNRPMAHRKFDFLQDRDHKIWTIFELFYRSYITFREQFERYEWRVLQHSYKKGQHRGDLRLTPEDLAGLLDLKALERLRDDYIHRLKDNCHEIFRDQYQTDLLDRYVSDIFHEISILKEEHYTVKTYAPQYARDSSAGRELSHILDEAHTLFPNKLNHIHFLFSKAEQRLEEILPSFAEIRVFIRSLYLHRNDFIKDAHEQGILHFYRVLYPELQSVEGYYQVGKSFMESGFFQLAAQAFQDAEMAVARLDSTLDKRKQARLRRLTREMSKYLLEIQEFDKTGELPRLLS